MEININDMVEIELTEYGESLLLNKNFISYSNYNQKTKVLREQLWVIMETFGEFFFNGGEQIIVNNTIRLNKKL